MGDIEKEYVASLKADALSLHEAINSEHACFSVKDVLRYERVIHELYRRGYRLVTRPHIIYERVIHELYRRGYRLVTRPHIIKL